MRKIKFNNYLFLFLILMFLSSCKKKQNASSSCTDMEGLYTKSNFPIGVAINMDSLRLKTVYKRTVTEQFNSITPENIFKPSFLHPSENHYNWFVADLLTDYCSLNNKRLHGHTLLWHNQLARWMTEFNGTEEQWETMFKEHIQTIVKHFKGKVSSWDVVNEAFNDDGTLRETLWKEHLGDSYLEKAFRYAREADPDVLLFYNDYLLEMNSKKRKNVLAYFNNLRKQGVKIDGIGIQCHINIAYPDISQIVEAFKDISDNHYLVHVSELDISVNPYYRNIEKGGKLYQQQADLLGAITLNYKQIPEKYQHGITFWGLTDANSWIPAYYDRKDYPLLYDANYQPKPAYCTLKEIL